MGPGHLPFGDVSRPTVSGPGEEPSPLPLLVSWRKSRRRVPSPVPCSWSPREGTVNGDSFSSSPPFSRDLELPCLPGVSEWEVVFLPGSASLSPDVGFVHCVSPSASLCGAPCPGPLLALEALDVFRDLQRLVQALLRCSHGRPRPLF